VLFSNRHGGRLMLVNVSRIIVAARYFQGPPFPAFVVIFITLKLLYMKEFLINQEAEFMKQLGPY